MVGSPVGRDIKCQARVVLISLSSFVKLSRQRQAESKKSPAGRRRPGSLLGDRAAYSSSE
jgi:hypothetical protein